MIIPIIYLLKNQDPITPRMSDEQYPKKRANPQGETLLPLETEEELGDKKRKDE